MNVLKRIIPLILLLLLLAPGFAQKQPQAGSSAALKQKKAALTKEIAKLNEVLKKTSGSKKHSLSEINALNAEIKLREEKIYTINSEIRLLDNQIEDNTHTVSALQTQLNKLKKEYAAMVQFAFRNRNSQNKLMFVFASRDFNQAYMRLKYISQFSEYRVKQAKNITETQGQLHERIVQLDENKKQKSDLLQDEQSEKQTLGIKKDKQTDVLKKLSKQEEQLQKQLVAKQQETAKLNRLIQIAINNEIEIARKKALAAAAAKAKAEAIAAAAKKKANPTAPVVKPAAPKPIASGSEVLNVTPGDQKLSADFASNRGRLPWPVGKGRITLGFGEHTSGINVRIFNSGVNIGTEPNASAMSVFAGEVTTARDMGGSYFVIIKHGQYFTVYTNLRSLSVRSGQKIGVRDVIGTVYTDPLNKLTELHFEVRKGAEAMNPASWLAR